MATAVLVIGGAKAKTAPDRAGHALPKVGTTSRRLARAIRELQPRKAWAYLAESLSLTERNARHRIYEDREFTVDELAALLRSEDGLAILTAVMADAQPKWWRLVSAFMDVAEAQRLQAVANRRIARAVRSAVDNNDELERTISRGTAALALSDPEFYGERLAPHRELLGAQPAASGVRNRTVARTEK